MKAVSLLIFILSVQSLSAVYRAYDVYRPGARAAGAAATGTANIDSVGSLAFNPAYLADISSTAVALGADAQTRIDRIQTDYNIEPQFIPVLAFGMPVKPNSGAGVMIYSPYQRRFPDADFIQYNIEGVYAFSLTRKLNIGVTMGAAMGLETERFDGWGYAFSLSALYHTENFNLGLLFRPGSTIEYSTYSTGQTLSEKMPDQLKGGISGFWGPVKLTFELEYINWDNSYFIENNNDITPDFEKHYLGRVHPHIGAEFPLIFWPGLNFRTGLYTEDFFDFTGNNERQILFTAGFGGLAGADLWGERLRIDFAIISGFIPSFFYNEAHQIEKIQVTFEFIY